MNYNEEYKRWLDFDGLFDEERAELFSIKDNEEAKALRFSSHINFGTAGLRSTMNMGTACMNRFTVAATTRALAELIHIEKGESRGVVIAYDSRIGSELFAKICASVLADEKINVYIFDSLRPTPELSFAVRELSAIAGINITASHNPKEYNGYKAYWEDGAQISPEKAKVVADLRKDIDFLTSCEKLSFDAALKSGYVTVLDEKFDEKYISALLKTSISPSEIEKASENLKVVYTPLHGAGYKLVPEVFSRIGLKHLYMVEEQLLPNGDFPTVKYPNPEYESVFEKGILIANRVGSDLVIATDPDSDRVGVVTRCKDGSFKTISGNQMGALLLDYVIRARVAEGTLPNGAFAVKSIVSSDMIYAIAEKFGITLHDVLTGFKYIGEVVKNYEERGMESSFIFGFEESYGYLFGSYARDKDAVGTSMMILEMAAYYKNRGMTLYDALLSLYEAYGAYAEKTADIYMTGLDGIEKMRNIMAHLRKKPPQSIGGEPVIKASDYISSVTIDLRDGSVSSTNQPTANVLYYTLGCGDKIIVRPSGTEPKIKIYVLAHDESREILEKKTERYLSDVHNMMKL